MHLSKSKGLMHMTEDKDFKHNDILQCQYKPHLNVLFRVLYSCTGFPLAKGKCILKLVKL